MDWVISYIGRPWINGTGDCWALVREVYRERLGIVLPLYEVSAHDTRQVIKAMRGRDGHPHWISMEKPADMCLAFFRISRHQPTHVAIYLEMDGGRFLHTSQRTGCVCESMTGMQRHGWRNPQYYQYCLPVP